MIMTLAGFTRAAYWWYAMAPEQRAAALDAESFQSLLAQHNRDDLCRAETFLRLYMPWSPAANEAAKRIVAEIERRKAMKGTT